MKRISSSVRRNKKYTKEWTDNAYNQFRKWRHELVKKIKKHLVNHMSHRPGARPR